MNDEDFELLKDYCQAVDMVSLKLNRLHKAETDREFQTQGIRDVPEPVEVLRNYINVLFPPPDKPMTSLMDDLKRVLYDHRDKEGA